MSIEAHSRDALIETARAELDRAHRGVLAMDASEVRRGLQIALTAMQDAASHARTAGPAPAIDQMLTDVTAKLAEALADLDDGSLAAMGTLIEDVRSNLA